MIQVLTNDFARKKRIATRFRKSIFDSMMNALGSAGLLDNIVNIFSCKVKDHRA
jgi:hypothetical protein